MHAGRQRGQQLNFRCHFLIWGGFRCYSIKCSAGKDGIKTGKQHWLLQQTLPPQRCIGRSGSSTAVSTTWLWTVMQLLAIYSPQTSYFNVPNPATAPSLARWCPSTSAAFPGRCCQGGPHGGHPVALGAADCFRRLASCSVLGHALTLNSVILCSENNVPKVRQTGGAAPRQPVTADGRPAAQLAALRQKQEPDENKVTHFDNTRVRS